DRGKDRAGLDSDCAEEGLGDLPAPDDLPRQEDLASAEPVVRGVYDRKTMPVFIFENRGNALELNKRFHAKALRKTQRRKEKPGSLCAFASSLAPLRENYYLPTA